MRMSVDRDPVDEETRTRRCPVLALAEIHCPPRKQMHSQFQGKAAWHFLGSSRNVASQKFTLLQKEF